MGGENFGRLTPQLFISFFAIKMARPEKQWLDYFSMDVEKDNKIKFLKAKFWLVWFAMYVELLQFIYKEWYYIEFTDDNMLLFMSETWLKEEETKLMLEFMLLKDLFNKSIFDQYWILTSTGIQKRYAEWTKKRNNIMVENAIWIVWNYDHIGLKDTLTQLKDTLTELIPPISTQSKVKESKLNKRKENNIFIPPSLQEVIDYFSANGYTAETAERAYRWYDVADRHDSTGKKVINWKQKMNNVRFKPENTKKYTKTEYLQIEAERERDKVWATAKYWDAIIKKAISVYNENN